MKLHEKAKCPIGIEPKSYSKNGTKPSGFLTAGECEESSPYALINPTLIGTRAPTTKFSQMLMGKQQDVLPPL
jgi:hypothetical protein